MTTYAGDDGAGSDGDDAADGADGDDTDAVAPEEPGGVAVPTAAAPVAADTPAGIAAAPVAADTPVGVASGPDAATPAAGRLFTTTMVHHAMLIQFTLLQFETASQVHLRKQVTSFSRACRRRQWC